MESYSNYSADEVVDSINLNIALSGNPAAYHYYTKDRLWDLFMKAVKNETFMKVAIFNNDFLKIAPVHTFTSYYIDDQVELSSFEKNSVGRIFKFVFEILGYSKDIRVYRKTSSIRYGKVFER